MHKKGFTLIEIIITVVLIGIVAGLGVGIITNVFTGYTDTETKNYLFNESKFIIERIDREIRNSIPNTVKLHQSNEAIQFATFSDASYYEEFHNKKIIRQTEPNFLKVGDNISIYNTHASHFYNLIRVYSVTDNSSYNITLNKNVIKDSPYHRFYIIDTPVTIYKSGNYIKRCFGYTIDINEDGIDSGTCNILGNYVDKIEFKYEAGNPWRNAIVNIDLTLQKNDVSITQKHQVNIRNVP